MTMRLPANFILRINDIVIVFLYLVYAEWQNFAPLSGPDSFLPFAILIFTIGLICHALGLYAAIWRFASIPDLANILLVAFFVMVTHVVVMLALGREPLSLLRAIEIWLVIFALLALPRIIYKVFRDFHTMGVVGTLQRKGNTLIIGHVDDASHFVSGLLAPSGERLIVAGILSPKASNLDRMLQGVPVIGMPGDLKAVIERLGDHGAPIKVVIIASPAKLPIADVLSVNLVAQQHGIRVLSFDETIEAPGRPASAPRLLRPFSPKDVLMRSMRLANEDEISAFARGKTFLVTGGGGSIGSSLVEALLRLNAARVVVVDVSEGNVAALLTVVRPNAHAATLECILGDVSDRAEIGRIIGHVRPDVVIHAAALKHVDLAEVNIVPSVRTNVFGTVHVADACREHGVGTCVFVSTDKAVEPVSVLGLTKRIGELYVDLLAREGGGTHFCSVRFGNVLGSTGSALPVFLKQIEAGGPVRLTSDDMIRYFMTAEEARDLILSVSAGATAHPDLSIYVLDIGKPMRIRDLVEQLIALHGLKPGFDIRIDVVGPRPGEKMSEILFAADETQVETRMPNVVGVRRIDLDAAELRTALATLKGLCETADEPGLRRALEAALTRATRGVPGAARGARAPNVAAPAAPRGAA